MKGLFLFFVLAYSHTPILLKNVQVLTMHQNQLTTARRGAPVKQMECVGGTCDTAHHPRVIQCYNQGTNDQGEVQWACKAELPKHCHLGTTTVSCEGYSSPEDDYVLAGSCGVEYTLHCSQENALRIDSMPVTSKDTVPVLLLALFVISTCMFILWFMCCCCCCCTSSRSADMQPASHHHYVTRSHTRVVEVEDEPVVVQRRRRAPVVVDTSRSTYDSGPGFWTGYAMGRTSSHHHHHYSAPAATHHHYSAPVATHHYTSAPDTTTHHTSTGYGGTKKR